MFAKPAVDAFHWLRPAACARAPQYLPWKHAVHDGMPTGGLMATGAAASLSHGSALFVLLAWYSAVLVPRRDAPPSATEDAALYASFALIGVPLAWLGLRRLTLLARAPPRPPPPQPPAMPVAASPLHHRSP
eukprot:4816544-Prymnesium_polylepis.1